MNLLRLLSGLVNLKLLTHLLAFQEVKQAKQCPCVVVFGRPGAGKTTVANVAVEKFKEDNAICIGLDLDVCVPQWMRDSFAKGIYPTLQQRQEFAQGCCDYVENELEEKWQNGSVNLATIVSFSFVNTDLRDVFRGRFPDSDWVLIDTKEEEATRRINRREDHFYKGDTSADETTDPDSEGDVEDEGTEKDVDNSEWNFAPVTFPHVALDGSDSVDVNAEKVLEFLLKKAGIRPS
jgi:gluconate kinase